METNERNKRIKTEISKVFGRENVSVKGDKGTAYGWVVINIKSNNPIDANCDDYRENRLRKSLNIENRVWEVLRKANLVKELGTYYDDEGGKHPEVNISVKFE